MLNIFTYEYVTYLKAQRQKNEDIGYKKLVYKVNLDDQ